MESEFSDYIIYADESGDHSLGMLSDKEYPVFVLAFCIFKKSDYAEKALCKLSQIKFNFWGHDAVILHSHKIRKQKEEFAILGNYRRWVKLQRYSQRDGKVLKVFLRRSKKRKTPIEPRSDADRESPIHLSLN